MKVFIAGVDGYLGWSLAQHLATRGHRVGGCDNGLRREVVAGVGSHSAVPIADIHTRLQAFREHYEDNLYYAHGDLTNYAFAEFLLRDFQPDAVVHLAELPSAPYSMMSAETAGHTQMNNVIGNLNMLWAIKNVCPNAHLIKLGTMGEYGCPQMDIPEGMCEMEFRGRKDWVMFPRKAGSFYHLSKVHDTHNVEFACRNWGLRATDIMQGVVYGTRIPEMGDDKRMLTRFDIDECFGTVINRFCASVVVGHPITIFGAGHQKRGFLPLKDSMQCLTLAIMNPPTGGSYRTFNQFEEVYDLTELAMKVQKVGCEMGLDVEIANYENPRKEAEEHYYNPDHQKLQDLGYQPEHDMEGGLRVMLTDLVKYRRRIEQVRDVLVPNICWDGTKQRSGKLLACCEML